MVLTAKPVTMLVVENEKDVIWFMRSTFVSLLPDIRFYDAASPQEAAILAAALQPDLILAEIFFSIGIGNLAGSYFGPWLIAKIRKTAPRSKIIVCSMLEDGDYGDAFEKDLKVDAYFKKPYDFEAVVEKSFELLGLPLVGPGN